MGMKFITTMLLVFFIVYCLSGFAAHFIVYVLKRFGLMSQIEAHLNKLHSLKIEPNSASFQEFERDELIPLIENMNWYDKCEKTQKNFEYLCKRNRVNARIYSGFILNLYQFVTLDFSNFNATKEIKMKIS